MEREDIQMLAKAIYDGLHEIAEAIAGTGCRLAEDMPLAEYIYNGLEKAARITRGLED